MKPHSLKTNIALHLVILLVLAMISINFIVITATQRLLISSAAEKGRSVLSAVEAISHDSPGTLFSKSSGSRRYYLSRIIRESGFLCLTITDGKGKPIFSAGLPCGAETELARVMGQAVMEDQTLVRYAEKTWGVFWQQDRYMIISAPLYTGEAHGSGVGLVYSLEPIYQRLRNVQGFILIYILINTAVLTLVGGYGLFQFTGKPLKKLVKIADEFKSHSELYFIHDMENTEFGKLSVSLNHMLKRISTDQKKLETTITSLQHVNQELKTAQKDILRAEKLATIGRLSTGIAHEIGNPIGIVTGYIDLLKQGSLPEEERKDFLLRVEKEIERINQIIMSLLESSRISQEAFTAVSVHEIIRDTSDIVSVQPLTEKLNLQLTLSAPEDTVLADPDQLRQVILNLIINASDAVSERESPPAGKIEIRTDIVTKPPTDSSAREKSFRIRFIDDGTGISKTDLKNIFDPFFTTKDPGKGTGLGLSVSYTIIDSFNGSIEANSDQEEGGTTITILLPLMLEERVQVEQSEN